MPQWVELPPNLVPCAATNGKSIYQTDFSSKRPGFQIHLQKAARGAKNFHHQRLPKEPSRSSLRQSQTGSYMSFKEEYDKNLAKNTSWAVPGATRTTPSSKDKEIYREVLSEYIGPSLDLARQAWKTETSAVNRDRERMYGLAGKKIQIGPKPPRTGDSNKPKEKVFPGMRKWLDKSNEYEKAVVCNFMDHVQKASTNQTPSHQQTIRPQQVPQTRPTTPKHVSQTRPTTPKHVSQTRPTTPKTSRPKTPQQPPTRPKPHKETFSNEYYYKQRAKSANSQRITDKLDLPPRPKSVHSFRNDDVKHDVSFDDVKYYEDKDADRSHGNHVHHTEGKCELCDYMRVKQLLEYLNRHESQLGEATLRHLLRPRFSPAYGYPAYEDYDYIHENSFFANTTARDRGYFIIAPDWVSERKGIPLPKHKTIA